jgi:hypothetical protein
VQVAREVAQELCWLQLQEIRSNTVGPVVASLLRHEEKGRRREGEESLAQEDLAEIRRLVGGREEEGRPGGLRDLGGLLLPFSNLAAQQPGYKAMCLQVPRRAGLWREGGRVDWCKDAEGRTGQGPDAHDWSEVRAAGRWDLNLGTRGVGWMVDGGILGGGGW